MVASHVPPDVQRIFEAAIGLHRQGRLDEAEALYRGILQRVPDHVRCLHGLGLIRAQTGRNNEALDLLRQALLLTPDDAGLHGDLGNVLFKSGYPVEAAEQFVKVVALEPGSAAGHANLGLALKALGRSDVALRLLSQAIALDPRMIEPHIVSGDIALAAGNPVEAAKHFQAALDLRAEHIPALRGLADALLAQEQAQMALSVYQRLRRAVPDDVAVILSMAHCLHILDRTQEALAAVQEANRLTPEAPEPLAAAGHIYLATGRLQEAYTAYFEALSRRPGFATAMIGAGNALNALGRPGEALAIFRKRLAANPSDAAAQFGSATALHQLGRMSEGLAALESAVALAPNAPKLHYALAKAKRFTPGDARLRALEVLEAEMANRPARQRGELQFALWKACDDLGLRERAYGHLAAANALIRSSICYDVAAELAVLERIRRRISAEEIAALQGGGITTDLPIFIVGMPRSGTSLVEQILASHPGVTGAGEVNFLEAAMAHCPGLSDGTFAAGARNRLAKVATRYIEELQAVAPDAQRIVDKMPGNFRFAGQIHLVLPNARIIHMKRDAKDTCFSCYSTLFEGGLNFTYDMTELARIYRGYEALRCHWKRVLPAGSILDVQYEDLIADFEGGVRRILDHCGLEWDVRCLRFYETSNAVRTASLHQVRQPLFSSSIGRWRPYERWLTPLIQGLGS